jgi:cell division septal protein FtsQ
MFGKKQPPPPGRQRPLNTADRRNAAVFSYHNASARNARVAGGTGRDTAAAAQQSAQAQREASQKHAANALRLGKLPLRILLVVVSLFLLSSLYVSSEPALVIETDGADKPTLLRDQQVYEQAAAQLIGGSPFNHIKPTLNTQRIATELDKQFPELGDVSVVLPSFGHQLEIHAEPATPVLIMSNNTGQSFVLDTNGRALMQSMQALGVGKLGLPVVTDQSGITLRAGRAAIPSSTARFISEVASQLKAAKLNISSLTLAKGTSELDVRIEGQPYTVKFNLMADGRVEAGSFLAVKQQLDRDNKTPASYIDVRVDGRAYYK